MRKRLLALVLLSSLVMTGCMSTTLEEKKEKEQREAEKNGGTSTSPYVDIEDLDFESGHVEGLLRENFRIDADVSVNVPTECGTYELARKKQDMTETEYAQYFDEIIDNYFGSDVTTSVADFENPDMAMSVNSTYANGNMGEYYKKIDQKDRSDYSLYHSKLRVIERNFYEYGLEYDREFVDGVVNSFMEKCSGIIPDGINGDYVCIHIDKEYMDNLREKYGMEISEIRTDWEEDNMEYYAICMYPEIEEGIYFKGVQTEVADLVEGEVTDEVCEKQYYGDTDTWHVVSHNPQYIEMIVKEDGEIVSIRIEDYYTIGEKINSNTILTAKEALEKFSEAYDGILMEEEMVVKSLSLEYTVDMEDEPGEDGYRDAVLVPVWVVRYKSPLPYWVDNVEMMMTISAIDGSIYAN